MGDGWVKERDPFLRRKFVPQHDHWVREAWDPQLCRYLVRRSVPCDLDFFLSAKGWVGTRCRLVHRGGRNVYCGCELCTGQVGRRLARRQERVRWRSIRQELLAATGREDLDVAPIRGRAW